MSRPVQHTSAITINPTSFDSVNSSYASNYNDGSTAIDGIYSGNVISNGFAGSGSTTRAAFFTNTGQSAASYFYYNFDCSSIPQTATINSVACAVKCGTQGTNYYNTRQVQLCAGTTPKGNATTISGNNTSPSTHTLTVGTWTREELNNCKVRIYITRLNSTGTGATEPSTVSFYGATLTVNYSVDGTMYEINASSDTTLATVEPSSQEVFQGGSGVVKIDVDNVGDIIVKDNDTDVTSQLVVKEKINSGSSETVLGTYTLVSGGFNGNGASYFQGLVGKGVNGSQTTSNYYSNGSGSIAVFTYNLTFSNIPSNATITRLYCQVNGHAESTSNNSEYMCAQLILGNTATTISDELNFKSVSTSNSTQTLEATTLPTVAQLSNLKLKCRLGYYGGAINGATCYIEYTIPAEGNQFYYEYTVNNIAADHTILVTENIIVPPEEDPDKTYYPITISSINATTNPAKGTTRVESGTSQTITITPSDPQLTLALDNGVDVTSRLVAHGTATPSSAITNITTSYGFTYNSSTGYYVSNNAGVGSSAAVARITFDLPVRCIVTFQYINYAEATYDFGVFSKVDTALSTSAWNSSQYAGDTATDAGLEEIRLNTSSYNTANVQTLNYEIPAGEHFIDVKYAKDEATDSNNDSLQFKITSIELLEPTVGYYTYGLNNINQSHSLIFIFGDVTYYFVTSNTSSNAKLYPNGQMVALPGDDYRLTIVPEKPTDTVSLTDNGTDVTGNLERKEVQTEKEGQTITTVNYIYRLTNIQTAHALNVFSAGGQILSVMSGGTWVSARKVFKRDERGWNEVNNYESLFEASKIYIPKQG